MILRGLLLASLAGLAALYYWGLGPPPSPSELVGLPWWRPRGFLVRRLADVAGPAGLLFAALPVGVALAGQRLFPSAAARTGVMGLALGISALALSGFSFPLGWGFFQWRFPLVLAVTACFTSVALFAPSLLAATLRQPPAARALLLLAAAGAVYMLSTEITGWDPALSANLSAWPVLTLFGFLLIGYAVAALHVAAGLGASLTGLASGRAGSLGGALVAALAAGALAMVLVSEPGWVLLIGMAVLGGLYTLAVGRRPGPSGPVRLAAGALLAAVIFLSNWAGERNHELARNQVAGPVLAALEAFRGERGEYPESLEELVPAFLEQVPRPRMGWIAHEDERFTYLNFGESYALEFPSILWIQCAYSPPYLDLDEDEEYLEEGADVAAAEPDPELQLAGSWSCDKAPPPLW